VPSAEDIYYDRVDKVVHPDDMFVDMFFEMFQFGIVEFQMEKSLLEISRIDNVTSRFRMFFLFENIQERKEILIFFLQEKHEHYDDNQDHDRYEDKYSSHYFLYTK